MKSETHTVQQLFERDGRYIVPLYQRPYVWDQDNQWEPLWEDVRAMLIHQENDGAESIWTHFLGAIVLDGEKSVPGHLPRFIVIDGQQRLTTLQLMLGAAARALAAAGCADDAALLDDLVKNNPVKAKEATDQWKVWPTNADRAGFVAAMSAEPSQNGSHNARIQRAVAFFEQRAAEYLAGDEHDAEDPAPGAEEDIPDLASTGEGTVAPEVALRAERIRITLCDLLKVVSITLEDTDNAQIIFETLNARGTPLLALDLTKNAVFAEAQRQKLDTDELYTEVWQPQLDDEYWRRERRQGRLNRPIGELFLMHWLTMQTADLIPATELFATFRRQVLAKSPNAGALIRELCADAAVMRGFDSPEPGTPEAVFFARLQALDAGTVLPIVLLLFRSPEITVERRRRALRILESWLTRRALTRLTAKNYNRLVPRLVARMKSDLEHADNKLFEGLAGGEGEISRWPSDAELRGYLTTRPVYGWVSQPRLIMTLAGVETSLYDNKVDVPALASTLSLEHLMPQEWEAAWPLAPAGQELSEDEAAAITQARQDRLHRIGNLTIVTSPLNSSLSNGPWDAKRKGLNQHSKLLMNAQLAEEEAWDTDKIDERTARLADAIVGIWPGPDPAAWT